MMALKRGKKAQITIFIIIAVIIFVLIVLLFFTKSKLTPQIKQPNLDQSQISLQFDNGIRQCIKDSARKAIKTLADRGGDKNEELNAVQFRGNRYTYLCYQGLNYESCVNQAPDLKGKFEVGIKEYVKDKGKICVNDILQEAEENGFEVEQDEQDEPKVEVVIKRGKVSLTYNQKIRIKKGENKISFNSFSVDLESDLDLALKEVDKCIFREVNGNGCEGLRDLLALTRGSILEFSGPHNCGFGANEGSHCYEIRLIKEDTILRFATRSYVIPAGLY